MDNFINPLRRLGAAAVASQAERALRKSCIGRIVSAITFFFIVLCMGLWGATFWLFYQSGLSRIIPENISMPVLAIAFFGGFLIAIVIGGLVGNALRRIFWRRLLRRYTGF